MIKISDKILYVVKLVHEDNPAYMCGMIKIFDMVLVNYQRRVV